MSLVYTGYARFARFFSPAGSGERRRFIIKIEAALNFFENRADLQTFGRPWAGLAFGARALKGRTAGRGEP